MEEAVRTLEEITPISLPLLGSVPPLHWTFSDRSGETVIVEPDQEGLHIYRRTVGVMTNSPGYPWHRLNLLNYAGARDLEHLPPDLEDCPASCFSASGKTLSFFFTVRSILVPPSFENLLKLFPAIASAGISLKICYQKYNMGFYQFSVAICQ